MWGRRKDSLRVVVSTESQQTKIKWLRCRSLAVPWFEKEPGTASTV